MIPELVCRKRSATSSKRGARPSVAIVTEELSVANCRLADPKKDSITIPPVSAVRSQPPLLHNGPFYLVLCRVSLPREDGAGF